MVKGIASIMIIVGLSMAIYASNNLIESVLGLGSSLNLDEGKMGAIMGTSVSAVGTSLPELTVALLCARKSQGVAIGALIGSNITDPLLSVGIAAMIHPLAISSGAMMVTKAIIMPMTILGVITCTLLMWTDFKFNRLEDNDDYLLFNFLNCTNFRSIWIFTFLIILTFLVTLYL